MDPVHTAKNQVIDWGDLEELNFATPPKTLKKVLTETVTPPPIPKDFKTKKIKPIKSSPNKISTKPSDNDFLKVRLVEKNKQLYKELQLINYLWKVSQKKTNELKELIAKQSS